MATRSLTRELALLVLGQVPEQKSASVADLALDSILDQALDTLTQHWRESLDASAAELDQAQQSLLDSELQQGEPGTHDTVRTHLRASLSSAEQVLNGLSASLELPRLLLLGDQEQIRRGAMDRVQKVLTQREGIDKRLDQVMETALVTVPVLKLGLVKVKALVLEWAQGLARGPLRRQRPRPVVEPSAGHRPHGPKPEPHPLPHWLQELESAPAPLKRGHQSHQPSVPASARGWASAPASVTPQPVVRTS